MDGRIEHGLRARFRALAKLAGEVPRARVARLVGEARVRATREEMSQVLGSRIAARGSLLRPAVAA